jgi:hypothetical protein
MLAQITAPHLCAGIILRNDVVVDAAPILRWMIGKSRDFVRSYCARKGWSVVVVTEN